MILISRKNPINTKTLSNLCLADHSTVEYVFVLQNEMSQKNRGVYMETGF